MNDQKKTLILLLILISNLVSYAKTKVSNDPIVNHFDDIGLTFRYHYDDAITKLDSLEESFSAQDYEYYQPYLDYVYGLIALQTEAYDRAIHMLEGALINFMYDKNDEWTAKCLILLGDAAEVTLLLPEAINAYSLAANFSVTLRSKCVAELGSVRNQMRLGREWQADFDRVITNLQEVGSDELYLYSKLIPYWFNKDSADAVVELPKIAAKFKELGIKNKESDSYKCLAFYYRRKHDYENALKYISLSISTLSDDSDMNKMLLTSDLYFRGQIYILLGRGDDAFVDIYRAIEINNKLNRSDNNYSMYRFLANYEKRNGQYKTTVDYLELALSSYKHFADARTSRGITMSDIFQNIKLIQDEIDAIEKEANVKMIVSSILLVVFFVLIILWLRKGKRNLEIKSAFMEDTNIKLKVETGELLSKVSQAQLKHKVMDDYIGLERKVDRYLGEHDELSLEIKAKYAETLLCFNINLPKLSDSERRYASMIALGVPYKNIADLLNVKPTTVSQYRNRIRKKLGIANTEVELEEHLRTFID